MKKPPWFIFNLVPKLMTSMSTKNRNDSAGRELISMSRSIWTNSDQNDFDGIGLVVFILISS